MPLHRLVHVVVEVLSTVFIECCKGGSMVVQVWKHVSDGSNNDITVPKDDEVLAVSVVDALLHLLNLLFTWCIGVIHSRVVDSQINTNHVAAVDPDTLSERLGVCKLQRYTLLVSAALDSRATLGLSRALRGRTATGLSSLTIDEPRAPEGVHWGSAEGEAKGSR